MLLMAVCGHAQTEKIVIGDPMPAISLNSEIYGSITPADLKGKVVLISLFATWCPPCRRAMTVIDSIKPGYIEKGVKFVYITGETSPEKNWNDMIPNIHGDHYRLTNAQWETLMREQGIPGIPVYKVINKDGSTAFSNFTMGGYPGNEVIKPILDEALKK